MENTGIVERALISVQPGTAGEFIAAFATARKYVERSPGFQKMEMRQGIESPDSFLLLIWWATLEDHTKGFRESDNFVQWRALLGPIFAAPPAVEHYAAPL
jgi:heme-degrading monooxygenase HmoA